MSSVSRKPLPAMTPDRVRELKTRPATSPANGRRRSRIDPSVPSPRPSGKRDRTVAEIEKLARLREERRKSADEAKRRREEEIRHNERNGKPGDVDFQRMISKFRSENMARPTKHSQVGDLKINVVVRKRPTNALEIRRKDHDSVTCSNPLVYVHDCKLRVDGITKYLDNTTFQMDHAFDEASTNDLVYENTAKPLVEFALQGGRSTCFAYGQTGSGKTYTMAGVQSLAAKDLFQLLETPEHKGKAIGVFCSFFELYGGRCVDLLNDKRICAVREDGKGRVCVDGLLEQKVETENEILDVIVHGNSIRTTHQTEMNDVSSRSHAICQIQLRLKPRREGDIGAPYGKLSLIDLAGSERGQDTKHHDKKRRVESAEINKSLLALKECIRALGSDQRTHVPYRASKLTMVLKDSFSPDSRTVMISCISPAASSADHTLNTLRYADRVKSKTVKPVSSNQNKNRNRGKQVDNEYVANDDAMYDDDDTLDEISLSKLDLDKDEESTMEESSLDMKNNNRELESSDTPSSREMSAIKSRPPRRQWNKGGRKLDYSSKGSPENSKSRIGKPLRANATPLRNSDRNVHAEHKIAESPGKDLKLLRSNIKSTQSKIPTATQSPHHQKRNSIDSMDGFEDDNSSEQVLKFHELVSALVDEEELLLNKHMECIQSNADWLTEEGELLAKVQGEDVVDYDIDEYATKLNGILEKKMAKIKDLHSLLSQFREHLRQEELASRRVDRVSQF